MSACVYNVLISMTKCSSQRRLVANNRSEKGNKNENKNRK